MEPRGRTPHSRFALVNAGRRRSSRRGCKEKIIEELKNIEEIATKIVAAAIKVHSVLGPGLLESSYQKCMEYELKKDGFRVACEVVLPITYEKIKIDAGYRIDRLWKTPSIVDPNFRTIV